MSRKQAVRFLILTIAAYLAIFYIVPHVSVKTHPGQLAVIVLTTIVFMGLQIALVRWFAELRLSVKTVLPIFLVVIALFLVGFLLIANGQRDRLLHLAKDPGIIAVLKRPSISSYSLLYTGYNGWLVPFMSLLLIAGATSTGYLVSFLLRERNIVLPVAVFAGFTDFWTVSVGPTAKMIKHAPHIVQAVSAPIPTPGAGHITPISFIGPGDFIFLALLFGAICRLGMNLRRTYWFVFPLLSLGMLGVIVGGAIFRLNTGFPALVLIAIGVILANIGEFRLQKSEIKAIVVVVGIILALALIITSILTHKP